MSKKSDEGWAKILKLDRARKQQAKRLRLRTSVEVAKLYHQGWARRVEDKFYHVNQGLEPIA